MASGWNVWVWLECIGLVSGHCCKEEYRFPHNITYFLQQHPTSLFIFKMFFTFLYIHIQ